MRPILSMITLLSALTLVHGEELAVQGDAKAMALVKKALESWGGHAGLARRRICNFEMTLSIPQEFTLPGGEKKTIEFKAHSKSWQKNDMIRIEQSFPGTPAPPQVIIYDGKELYLLMNGQKRDPGHILKKHFKQSNKRESIWWDCYKKNFKVSYLGQEERHGRQLALLSFTHPDGDKTTVGVLPDSGIPCYMRFWAVHPQTGQDTWWTQNMTQIKPVKEADGLLFPHRTSIYHGKTLMTTMQLKKVKTVKDLPDSLFGKEGKERPVD